MKHSNCCGAPDVLRGDRHTSEMEICAQCGEHCDYEMVENYFPYADEIREMCKPPYKSLKEIGDLIIARSKEGHSYIWVTIKDEDAEFIKGCGYNVHEDKSDGYYTHRITW